MAQVVAQKEQLKQLNTNVIQISFGTAYWANAWLSETESPYPLLLDQAHASYQAFGLDSSAWRAWSPRTIFYYAKQLLRGEKLIRDRGDTHQMGGDFIVDRQGIVRFAYASREPTDRPQTAVLLDTLTTLSHR